MILGERTLGHSRCRLGHSAALPPELSEVVELSALYTAKPYRKQGEATALLNIICGEADRDRTVLLIMPNKVTMGRFYQRFGFIRVQDKPLLMARGPR